MKKYIINDTSEIKKRYDIIAGEDTVIDPPQILPSSDANFFDTGQIPSGYPYEYPHPSTPNYPELIKTVEVDPLENEDVPSVFNFENLSSNFSEKELLEDPLSYNQPYIHYVPLHQKGQRKIGVYINYLADYKVITAIENPYQKYLTKINQRN
jgi:hypothetical protein